MDELLFPVNLNGKRCRLLSEAPARGQRIVFTPHAKLLRLEWAIQRRIWRWIGGLAYRELRNLRSKWGRVLAADPYYSPLLARSNTLFGTGLASGSAEPRLRLLRSLRRCRLDFDRGREKQPKTWAVGNPARPAFDR